MLVLPSISSPSEKCLSPAGLAHPQGTWVGPPVALTRVAATPLAARRRGAVTRLHPVKDLLRMQRGQELMEVCELMHSSQNLDASEYTRMEMVGATVRAEVRLS